MFSGSMKSKIHPHSELYGIITLKILWTGTYLMPAIAAATIEMTIPDKPRSSKQKYRLTRKGQELMRN